MAIKLGDACIKIGSGATPTGGKSSYLDRGPFALVRSQNVYNHGFEIGGLAFISDQQASKLNGVAVLPGDVLLNITGDSVARACLAPESLGPARVNQHVAIIRPDPNKLDARYLRYYLVNRSFQEHMLALASVGATRPALTKGMIESFEIGAPGVLEQREIGSILGGLDDKIELNRRMAATLEEMARALYRSWFVDFDPVKAKAEGLAPAFMDEATAALFPDRFGDDGLPEGWRRGALIDLSSLNPEKWVMRNAPDMVVYVDLSNTKWGVVEATTIYSWAEAPSRARMVLRPGDTIVGTVRPGNGSYAYIAEAGLTGSTGFAVLRPNRSNDAALVNLAATDADNIASLTNLADGGAYPAVRPEVVGSSEVVIAAETVRDAFAAQVTPIVNRIEEAKRESRSLAELRDALLPKLMSGEIRVGKIENQIEAVA